MDFFRGLPWRWIVPVLVIVALGSAVRAYAGALGRADAAADRVEEPEAAPASSGTPTEALRGRPARPPAPPPGARLIDSPRLLAGAATHQPQMTPVGPGQQGGDTRGFTMLPRRENDAVVGPVHGLILAAPPESHKGPVQGITPKPQGVGMG